MKCDHRSKFSNLSNWKEEAWKKTGLQRDSNPWPQRYRHIGSKVNLLSSYLPVQWNHVKYIWNNSYLYCGSRLGAMCGFIAQLVEHRTGIAEVMGSNLVEALIFFQASSFQLLKLENLLRWSHFTFKTLLLSHYTYNCLVVIRDLSPQTCLEYLQRYLVHPFLRMNILTSSWQGPKRTEARAHSLGPIACDHHLLQWFSSISTLAEEEYQGFQYGRRRLGRELAEDWVPRWSFATVCDGIV